MTTESSSVAVALFLMGGCALSPTVFKANFYDSGRVTQQLDHLRIAYPEIVHVEVLGTTHEGRPIHAARVGRPPSSAEWKPALVATFTIHADEHDVTNLGIGIIKALVSLYGVGDDVTRLLDRKDLWIVPLVNPDGADYDLSGKAKPMTWRKNRRPIGADTIGVDLNRNWGHVWDRPLPKNIADDLSDPHSDVYAGDHPFSEHETRALRDFFLAHHAVRMFVDYQSGNSSFLQGGVGFPIPPEGFEHPCHRTEL